MYLVTQSTYNNIELGIYQDESCLKFISINKLDATSLLIPELDKLLHSLKIRLSYLDFIAVNKGPAPFTTLRVLLSTINGISLATNIPLVEVSALECLLKSDISNEYKFTLVLLNAFSNDAYYALKTPKETLIGCENIDKLIDKVKTLSINETVKIIGNGVNTFKENLKELNCFIPNNNPEFTTLDEIAKESLGKWNQKETTEKILPLYLKEAVKTN